ncbi:hypothetical protein ACIA98_03225 [Streptomyces sp. NPDC051366]|uniref:hypothetical protein n=1 Tax=Streptomyces sp. NPDC051366 TaxID=3365652 RepID=UPI0037A29393
MNQEIATALIAAGAAVAGGAVTGLFTWGAAKRQADAAWAAGGRQADAAWASGQRQADAAWEAGRSQAEAQLAVAQQTLSAQALAAERDVRRAAYLAFLEKAQAARRALAAYQQARGTAGDPARRREFEAARDAAGEALDVVRLMGPDTVVTAAETLESALSTTPGAPYATAAEEFLAVARAALTAA